MRRIVIAVVLALACGGDSSGPATDVEGLWRGTITSSASVSYEVLLDLQQDGAAVDGTYVTSFYGTGTVDGHVEDRTFTFAITVTSPGCPGSVAGTATVDDTDREMVISYSGSTSCGGPESGHGVLTRQ